MEEIIAPVSKELLKAELTADKRLRYTNKSHNEIYVVTWQDSPNVLREIGRCVKSLSGLPVEVRGCRSIWMTST